MHDECRRAVIDADRRRLVRAAARLLGAADAEDAVQDACVRALEAEPIELDAAQAWLMTVVRHLAIDRLRRRRRMAQWLAELLAGDVAWVSPADDTDAALAEEAALALRLLAARTTPKDGAVVLLHEVFEVSHAELARASGRSEAGSRQQLRRALSRLRQANGAAGRRPDAGRQPGPAEPSEEAAFRVYLQSLRLRDPSVLWAMLRQPPIGAVMQTSTVAAAAAPAPPPATACGVMQVSGRLGLVLTLDGVRLCVLPLGVQPAPDLETAVP